MDAMFESPSLTQEEKIFGSYMQKGKLILYNGGTKCDVFFEGPCACGAWHFRKEFIERCNRHGSNLWRNIVVSCVANEIPVPDSIAKYDVAALEEREW